MGYFLSVIALNIARSNMPLGIESTALPRNPYGDPDGSDMARLAMEVLSSFISGMASLGIIGLGLETAWIVVG